MRVQISTSTLCSRSRSISINSLNSRCAANTQKAEALLQLASSGNEVWKKYINYSRKHQAEKKLQIQQQYCKTVAPASTTLINIIIITMIIRASTFDDKRSLKAMEIRGGVLNQPMNIEVLTVASVLR